MNSLLLDQKFKKFPKLTVLGLSIGFAGIFSQIAIASDYIGNRGVQFNEDTIIEFEFLKSHGAYQSSFGVIDLDTCQTGAQNKIIFDTCDKTPLLSEVKPSDTYASVERRSSFEDDFRRANSDFEGTPGNTVLEPLAEFFFERGKRYAFYLESNFNNKPVGTVYSLDFFNKKGNRQALFNQNPSSELVSRRGVQTEVVNNFSALTNRNGGLVIRFNDTGSDLVQENDQDLDFDDFVVGIGGYENCGCSN